MTIQRNSNHILDLNRILKRKPHKFDGEEGSSRIFTGTSDGPSNEVLTTNNNNSLSNLAPIKSDNINYNPNDGYKTYKVDPDGTEKSNFKEPEGKEKITGSQVAGAISAVAGGLTGMYAGYKGNSTIADTSGYKKQANSIANSSSSAETNDALLNDMNSFNPMNNVSYGQVRGASNGDMAKNTLNSVASGASAGSVAGPWGAAIGAVVGLGTGVAGIFSGNSKARREKRRLNGQIAAANQSAINNFANTASNINTNTNINLGRNYFAQGGHLFKNGNNVHVGVPSMLAARNESKPYLPTVTKQTMKTGKVYNYYDSDHDKKPVKKVHTKSLVGNQVFIPLSPYQWTKDYVNSDVFKNRLANIFNYRNDNNDELYNEVKHNIDNVGIFDVDMKKPTSYFINRLPSNVSGAIYNHRKYDGYGDDAASFYDPVENIVINDVSKQKDKRFDNGDYYGRAVPHELGHTMDPYYDLSHAQYFSKDMFGHKYIDDGVSFDNNRHSYQQLYDAHKSNPFINFEHESYAHENYADIHALRYNLYKFGIKDIANGDVITKSDLTKYKKIISKLPAGPRNAFSRIFSVFDDDVIINMLNKRASNDTNKQSSIKQNIFAEGGHIDEKKAVETPGQWERRYVNSPEFEKRYKSILYHGADVPSLQDIRDQVNNTHYLHVNFDNGMGSRQMAPLNVRTNVADTYDYGLRHKNEFELSHYVKPVGKGNPWIVEDTRPYPATADFTKDNVMPHEYGHVIDFNNYLSTAEYNDDGSTQPDPKYMFDANRKPIDKANSSINYSHDSKEAENYADINALKYNLYKFGIKDIANGDIVTIDDIKKFKDIINKMPVKQRNAYNRIFYLFDDDAIVRFLNKLADSNNHPDVNVPSVNVFAEGGDLDYDAIKQSYNDSNTGYSKFNHSSGWIKDYMRDHMKTGLVADGSVDAATMKGIKKANMNMNMFYTSNGTDGEEMSNNVDYGWVKKNNPSQLYQYENQNLPTNGDKVQQSNLGSSTSSKAAKKAAPINVSKSKFYANIQQETKANPQLNETMSIAYNYLIKKGFKPVNASAIVGCIYAESRMNPQQDDGDHCGLLQWTKFKTENNKKKFGDRYNKLIEHTKQLEGDKYKDGDENLLLNQLAFIADDLRSKDFNNDKVKLIHTLSKSQSVYDSAKAIMEIYGGDDKDKYSPTERAAYALYCLKNISTMKQDNNKDKK
jgi:hypothetical protein